MCSYSQPQSTPLTMVLRSRIGNAHVSAADHLTERASPIARQHCPKPNKSSLTPIPSPSAALHTLPSASQPSRSFDPEQCPLALLRLLPSHPLPFPPADSNPSLTHQGTSLRSGQSFLQGTNTD